MSEFDQLADLYDETRGGERRGDEYAADIDALIPAGDAPILEVGVGTGVVALGLARRGRKVVGLDISGPMLLRAKERLGPIVVRADAMEMAIASDSVAHAVSVWVVHAVADPVRLFSEAARVIRPGGTYVVCTGQLPAVDDAVGQAITEMTARLDARRGAPRPRRVTVAEVLGWAGRAGFTGTVHELQRQWYSKPSEELAAIARRAWPTMRELDDVAVAEAIGPTVDALRALPDRDYLRRATSDMLVLGRP